MGSAESRRGWKFTMFSEHCSVRTFLLKLVTTRDSLVRRLTWVQRQAPVNWQSNSEQATISFGQGSNCPESGQILNFMFSNQI